MIRRWQVGLGVATFSVAAPIAWLLRDPAPRFDARQGTLVAVEVRTPVLDGPTEEQDILLTAASGLRFELAVRRPSPDAERPGGHGDKNTQTRLRVFLVLGGHERGKGAGALIGDTRGTIFASMEYPFDGDHRAKGLKVVAQVPAIRRALYDIPPAVSLALDYLLSRPDVDPERIELVGASFGAPFATIAAARDDRVTRLWLAHGGGDTYAMISRGLERDIAFGPARALVAGLANLLASGPRFTPERWVAQVAPRPVVMLNAEDDEKIPRRSVDVLFSAARHPKELIWLPGQHMQGNRPDVLERLVEAVLARAALADAIAAVAH